MSVAENIDRFAQELRVRWPDAQVDVEAYPTGAANLDVRREDRLFVMAFSPTRGFGVDEVLADDGLLTSYRYVSAEFEPAAQKLIEIAGEAKQPAPKLSLIVLYAADLSKSKQFYETLGLQFASERHAGGPDHFACPLGDSVFELYPRKASAQPAQAVRIGFQVSSVDAAVERLRVTGVEPISLPQNSAWGRRAVIRDPDGNTVEITSAAQI